MGILDSLGGDLAYLVELQNLPVVELDIDIPRPRIDSYRFFPLLLTTLARVMNSVFLVGDDLEYLNAYINSLAILMIQPDKFAKTIRSYSNIINSDLYPNRTEQIIERLIGKRLHTLDIEKFLSLSWKSNEDWNTFEELIKETQERGYFLVIDQIHRLFSKNQETQTLHTSPTETGVYPINYKSIPRAGFYFATRGKVRLTFIAPLLWPDYVKHIEGIPMTQHRKPFFFNPRPPDLPCTYDTKFDRPPDEIFDFSKLD